VLGAGEAAAVGEESRCSIAEGAADAEICLHFIAWLAGITILQLAREAALHFGFGCIGLVVAGLAKRGLDVALVVQVATDHVGRTAHTDSALVAIVAGFAIYAGLIFAENAQGRAWPACIIVEVEASLAEGADRGLALDGIAFNATEGGAGEAGAVEAVVAVIALTAGSDVIGVPAVGQSSLAAAIAEETEAHSAEYAVGGVGAG
jgi:hypothetical protein